MRSALILAAAVLAACGGEFVPDPEVEALGREMDSRARWTNMMAAPDGHRYSIARKGVIYWAQGPEHGSITNGPEDAIPVGAGNGGLYFASIDHIETWFIRSREPTRMAIPGRLLEVDPSEGGVYLTVLPEGDHFFEIWWHDPERLVKVSRLGSE